MNVHLTDILIVAMLALNVGAALLLMWMAIESLRFVRRLKSTPIRPSKSEAE